MPCNCRQGIGSHDHMADGFVRDGALGTGTSINDYLDLSGLQIWNSTSNATEARRLFDPNSAENANPVCSDDDPELLLLIPLSSVCRLRGITVQGPCSGYAPKQLKLFSNNPDIVGFDSVRRLHPDEEIQLAQTSLDDRIIYRVNQMKFSSVGCLAFFFDHSYNDEETHIFRIELFGESTGIPTKQKLATNLSYELHPNPEDHRNVEEFSPFITLQK